MLQLHSALLNIRQHIEVPVILSHKAKNIVNWQWWQWKSLPQNCINLKGKGALKASTDCWNEWYFTVLADNTEAISHFGKDRNLELKLASNNWNQLPCTEIVLCLLQNFCFYLLKWLHIQYQRTVRSSPSQKQYTLPFQSKNNFGWVFCSCSLFYYYPE